MGFRALPIWETAPLFRIPRALSQAALADSEIGLIVSILKSAGGMLADSALQQPAMVEPWTHSLASRTQGLEIAHGPAVVPDQFPSCTTR